MLLGWQQEGLADEHKINTAILHGDACSKAAPRPADIVPGDDRLRSYLPWERDAIIQSKMLKAQTLNGLGTNRVAQEIIPPGWKRVKLRPDWTPERV
jgi:hypothetical protein